MASQVLTRGFCHTPALVLVRGFGSGPAEDDGYWDEWLRRRMRKRREVETEDEAAIMYLIEDFMRRQPWL